MPLGMPHPQNYGASAPKDPKPSTKQCIARRNVVAHPLLVFIKRQEVLYH